MLGAVVVGAMVWDGELGRTHLSGAVHTTKTVTATDVFAAPPVATYLTESAKQSADITAAVLDAKTDQVWTYRPNVQLTTASIIKIDVLETMLAQDQAADDAPSADQQALAVPMIEESDDDAATDLWYDIGGAPAVTSFNNEAGLTETVANTEGYWGLSTTSALDQVRLVEKIAFANPLLTDASRSYALSLMTDVDPNQAWGVSAGVPAGVTVALKNGWDPINGIWEINSIGYVDGDGCDYVIAILCWGEPTEQAGINVVDGLSQQVWAQLAARAPDRRALVS